MKKLLTMMVSCASALFAMADGTWSSGTDFQGYRATVGGPAISLDITKNDSNGEGDKYWYSTATESEAVVTNNGNAYLMLDTSSVLERTINPWTPGDTPTFAPQDIGTGIYFDSKVQFTATEDDVALSDDGKDKLIVWLKAVEGTDAVGTEGDEDYVAAVPASTNLMITAGNGVDGFGKAIRADFVASGVSIEPNSWHQLTIKAFVDADGDTLFNVYIDKNLVTGVLNETSVTDFESLVSKEYEDFNPTTITSVGFRGTGAVDDLLFTNEDPLAQTFPLTVVVPQVPQGCELVACLVSGNPIDGDNGSYLVDVTATDVKAWVTVPKNYKVTNEGATYSEADGVWVVPVDITGATANETFSFTVTVEAKGVPGVPTIGDKEVEFDESGFITNITTADNGEKVVGVADPEAFSAMFEKCYTVNIVDGKLIIALNDNAKPVIGEADVDGDDTEEPAVQIVDGKFVVTIQDSFKSLKYKLQYKAGLGNDSNGDPYTWGDVVTTEVGDKGDAIQLSAPVDGDKGFYRVVVEE